MVQKQFTFEEFSFSSALIRDLVAENNSITNFIALPFTIPGLSEQAKVKVFDEGRRELLVSRLKFQNRELELSSATAANIELLNQPNSFTITTGHQLNLLSGPLYSIYKVAQVISLCREANIEDTSRNYIPVFWMATEDHDFEEINHLNLFNHKIEWKKAAQENCIAGEIEPVKFELFVDEILALFRDENEKEKIRSLTHFYTENKNLAEATRGLMNHLFGDAGLVILDGNDSVLKKVFAPIIAKELTEGFVYDAVTSTNQKLEAAGYHQQVYLRNCNLFAIEANGTRVRIGKVEQQFFKGEEKIELKTLLEKLEKDPASFSPNALLRPVYQEFILPNLAYIGGGGEISYWLQLKQVFETINLPFPMLRVRDSLVLLKQKDMEEMQRLNLSLVDLKRDLHDLVREMALEEVEIELELHTERERLGQIKNDLVLKANEVGQGLVGMIEAEFSKMDKTLERIESKLIKAEKSKHEQKATKIAKLQAKIFPNNGFQERYENFLPYFLADVDFVSKIVDNLKAADKPVITLIEI